MEWRFVAAGQPIRLVGQSGSHNHALRQIPPPSHPSAPLDPAPGFGLLFHPWFLQIVKDGTDKTFELEHNRRWLEVTRPILEAFFHARYFLEMAVRYGRDLGYPPRFLPSGWAALLNLYDLR